MYEHLRPYDINDICDIEKLEGASIKQVFDLIEDWKQRKDILIYHYGGHAEGAYLLLDNESGGSLSANARGLAKLLGQIPSLQLVFLNGCSTYEQVKLLLDSGVKAVIATSAPIQDQLAQIFSNRFYRNLSSGQNLEESFNQACQEVQSYEQQVTQATAFRSLEFDQFAAQPDQMPWGLYYQPDRPEVLKWKLPQTVTAKDSFSLVDKYTCNRSDQNSLFQDNFFDIKGKQKFLYYLIHGEDDQSPNGLFNRFVHEHLGPAYGPDRLVHKIVTVEPAATLNSAKLNVATALFKALELNPNQFDRSSLTIKSLVQSPILQGKTCVAIKLRIYSSDWKPFTDDYIQWAVNTFCDSSLLPNDAPDFLFFVGVVYDDAASTGKGLLGKLFSKSPRQKILKAIQNFSQVYSLPELPPVLTRDINKWLDKFTNDPAEKNAKIDQYFQGQTEWDMIKVERELEKIINEFNEQKLTNL